MLLVDVTKGKVIDDNELKEGYASRQDVYKRQGLEEAIAYEKGRGKARVKT